jgi:hypothetical protein
MSDGWSLHELVPVGPCGEVRRLLVGEGRMSYRLATVHCPTMFLQGDLCDGHRHRRQRDRRKEPSCTIPEQQRPLVVAR